MFSLQVGSDRVDDLTSRVCEALMGITFGNSRGKLYGRSPMAKSSTSGVHTRFLTWICSGLHHLLLTSTASSPPFFSPLAVVSRSARPVWKPVIVTLESGISSYESLQLVHLVRQGSDDDRGDTGFKRSLLHPPFNSCLVPSSSLPQFLRE